MSATTTFLLYRMLIVSGGIACIFWGYRLFSIVQTKQGDLQVKSGKAFQLRLSDVAPGVFFALFGTAVLGFCLVNGVTIKFDESTCAGRVPTEASTRTEVAHGSVGAPDVHVEDKPACISQRPGECK